jgi:hypothetical protein
MCALLFGVFLCSPITLLLPLSYFDREAKEAFIEAQTAFELARMELDQSAHDLSEVQAGEQAVPPHISK